MLQYFLLIFLFVQGCGSVSSALSGGNGSPIRSSNINDIEGYMEDLSAFKNIQKKSLSGEELKESGFFDDVVRSDNVDRAKMLLASGIYGIEEFKSCSGKIGNLYKSVMDNLNILRKEIEEKKVDEVKVDYRETKEKIRESMALHNVDVLDIDGQKKRLRKELKDLNKEFKQVTALMKNNVGDFNLIKELNEKQKTITEKKEEISKELKTLNNPVLSSDMPDKILNKKPQFNREKYLKDKLMSQEIYDSSHKVENPGLLIALLIMFKENRISLDFEDSEGLRALSVFVDEEYIESVKLIYFAGADVNFVTPTGNTLLHIAALKLSEPISSLLINIGLDKGKRDSSGQSPYEIAFGRLKRKGSNNDRLLEMLS